MIMNFEENVYYFTELVFNNIQSAKVKKNKRKEMFKYLKIKSNGNKIVVNSKRHSFILSKRQIEKYNFKQYLTKFIALYYIEDLNKMKIEHQRIINEIAIEESQHIELTVNEVKFFLVQLRKGNINDIKYRRLLINTLIYQVFLYDDSITIVFNTQGKPYEKKIPRPEVLESSLLGNDALPYDIQANLFYFVGGFAAIYNLESTSNSTFSLIRGVIYNLVFNMWY